MLLINPIYLDWWTSPATSLGWIAVALERIGKNPKIIDCKVTPNYIEQIQDALGDYAIVGIYVAIGNISSAREISLFIRRHSPSTRIIMGGPHATAIYERLIPQYADIVVLGEGEDTITELMQQEDLSKIKGIAYHNGSLKVNERRPLIEDLDRLGFPAWHLYDLKKYRFASVHRPFAIITTSRGCPYQCIYCTKFIHGYKIRLRSIDSVLSEIDYLVNKMKVREIQIKDDNFTFYPERVKQLCKRIIEKRYKEVRFSLPNGIRADITDFEMFQIMKVAGFYSVRIGVETGSQEVSDKLKRGLRLEKVKSTVNMLKKVGLKVDISCMVGLPFDTMQTIQETIDFVKTLAADNVNFSMSLPFPGTELYEMVKNSGRFLYDLELNSAAYEGRAVYEIGDLKSEDVNRMRQQAYRQLYSLPAQIWRILNIKLESFSVAIELIKYSWHIMFEMKKINKPNYV